MRRRYPGGRSIVNTHQAGIECEGVAVQHLRQLGMQIVETNYRYGRGEIDIVARDGEVLVFCEVKSRTNDRYGDPEYALTPKKRQQIRRVAEGYLFEHEIKDHACRFDVVAIRWTRAVPTINYIRNAF